MTFKQRIHQHLVQTVQDKIARLQQALTGLKEMGANETKSTAGDKHETALAMIQLEQEKLRHQLKEAQLQMASLHQLKPEAAHSSVKPGSLVKTNHGYFYISIAGGKMMLENQVLFAISPQSPLGVQMLQKHTGQSIQLPQACYTIEEIC